MIEQNLKTYTLKEASLVTGISYNALRKLVVSGKIRTIQGNTKPYYIPYSELNKFINNSGLFNE